MVKRFDPVDLVLKVDHTQLCVLEDIHALIEEFKKRVDGMLPVSFPKEAERYLDSAVSDLEQVEYYWKCWVLEEFKVKMNSVEFFKDIGIKRVNPRDRDEAD